MEVWQSVKVSNPEHSRAGEAGVVSAVDRSKPDEVGVRFDTDLQVQLVAVADLVQL
jgi:hypothetical protein